MDEDAIPLPSEERTPPVMKIYFDVFGTNAPACLIVIVHGCTELVDPDGIETTHDVVNGQRRGR